MKVNGLNICNNCVAKKTTVKQDIKQKANKLNPIEISTSETTSFKGKKVTKILHTFGHYLIHGFTKIKKTDLTKTSVKQEPKFKLKNFKSIMDLTNVSDIELHNSPKYINSPYNTLSLLKRRNISTPTSNTPFTPIPTFSQFDR